MKLSRFSHKHEGQEKKKGVMRLRWGYTQCEAFQAEEEEAGGCWRFIFPVLESSVAFL